MVFSGEICTLEVVFHENLLTTDAVCKGRGHQCRGDAPNTAQLQLLTEPRHPQSSRNLLLLIPTAASGLSCWDQPGTGSGGVSEIHPGCQGWLWLGSQREGSSVFLGLAEGSVSPHMLHGHLCGRGGTAGMAEARCDHVLLSWALIHKSPYALQHRHPQERLPPTSSAVIFLLRRV